MRRYTDENMPPIHRDKTLEEYCSGGSGGHEGGHARSQPPTTPSSSTSSSLGSFPGYNKKHSSPLHEYFNGVGKFGTVRGKALGESDISLSLRKSYLECWTAERFCFTKCHLAPVYWAKNSTQLSNLWRIPNSVRIGFGPAMKMGSSRRFKRYPTTYMWVSSQLLFPVD